jgi:hypothetical protein
MANNSQSKERDGRFNDDILAFHGILFEIAKIEKSRTP